MSYQPSLCDNAFLRYRSLAKSAIFSKKSILAISFGFRGISYKKH